MAGHAKSARVLGLPCQHTAADGADNLRLMGAPSTATTELAANGLRFTALVWPGHGVPVLCLHGFPQRCTSWTGVAERLAAAGRRVVAPDQRGYSSGARPDAVAQYALPHLVADAVGMIEALGGAAHLVGHDWGAVVGWQVAARRPDLVRSWTALSTPHPLALATVLAHSAEQRERFGYIRRFRQVGTAEAELLAGGGAALAAIYQGRVPAERVAADVAFFSRPGVLTAALAWYRAMSRGDAGELPPVRVPTAYVWGSEDLAFGREAAEATGAQVRGAYRFVPLDGASHWLPDEAPDTVAAVIGEQADDD